MKCSVISLAVVLVQGAAGYETDTQASGETDPNVTRNCSTWANSITSGDTCQKLQEDFGIDFLQLHEWNPSLVVDPCSPIHGWSYCVDSPSKSNDLASKVGTAAPTLSIQSSTSASMEPSTTPTSASAQSTATTTADSSSSDTTDMTTSDPASTVTNPSSPEGTGGAAGTGYGDISLAILFASVVSLVFHAV
ncbi:hypothetical protein BDV06DRAFT_225904 [Aspergillus oleicola]